MITYTNIQRYENMAARDYFKLGGFSHSFCKYEKHGVVERREPTPKMLIGSLTDAILTDGPNVDVNSEHYPIAREFAIAIKSEFGPLITRFIPQVSYTATMHYAGLSMDTTGRLDWELRKHAVIDLKLTDCTTSAQFAALIKFMGYENQLWNYAKMQGVDKGFIVPFSTKLKKLLPIVPLDLSSNTNEFWINAILKHGTVQ